ncbi:MAG TPA: hypothetical protein VJS68_01255 [Thermoplasmata archaeon]|nr:hypothetical protein [Thermoplasmata archaeon]
MALLLVRGSDVEEVVHDVVAGTTVRALLRTAGLAPEGCAVLEDGVSVPLDRAIDRGRRFTVIRTFSGG